MDHEGKAVTGPHTAAAPAAAPTPAAPAITITPEFQRGLDLLHGGSSIFFTGNAKKAAQWGKPVLAADDFLDWAMG